MSFISVAHDKNYISCNMGQFSTGRCKSKSQVHQLFHVWQAGWTSGKITKQSLEGKYEPLTNRASFVNPLNHNPECGLWHLRYRDMWVERNKWTKDNAVCNPVRGLRARLHAHTQKHIQILLGTILLTCTYLSTSAGVMFLYQHWKL